MKTELTLHIYGQPFEHQPARIIGNKAALELLIATLQAAIRDGKAETPETTETCLFASDGEGYTVQVKLMPDKTYIRNGTSIKQEPTWWKPENAPQYIMDVCNGQDPRIGIE